LWEEFGCIWSKRLKVVISENINWIISKYNLKDEQINLISNISPSTIDRILRHHRIKHKKRLYCQTRPGSLLRREIPIIVEVANNINRPGHIQIDLVAHCGNSVSGEFLWTLNATDIFSQWTESQCILNKGEDEVISALNKLISYFPFNIVSINSDNGSEFINWELLRYCKINNILFTRTRPYKKDDNAYIEQKNWTNVRRIIGWDRFEGEKAKKLINDLYSNELSIFLNLFMPSVKLMETKKIGLRYKKIYDSPKTPLKRLIDYNPDNPKLTKYINFKKQTNPFELIKSINNKLEIIWTNKCKSVIKDKNYLRQQEILKNVDKLLKKEIIYG
ncbi:MAG: DDE-type integrase/transposase/recombinase, partial [Elusimicrobiales bacterium]|nr:DDE-type integrase/transposase/recombinase [Elusimicrobiales bacterium]